MINMIVMINISKRLKKINALKITLTAYIITGNIIAPRNEKNRALSSLLCLLLMLKPIIKPKKPPISIKTKKLISKHLHLKLMATFNHHFKFTFAFLSL